MKDYISYISILFLGIIILSPNVSYACGGSSPTGVAGDLTFNNTSNVPMYCDGSNWIAMTGGDPLINGGNYTPDIVEFDGATRLESTGITGASDSKMMTVSFWFNTSNTATFLNFADLSSDAEVYIGINGTQDNMWIQIFNAANTRILRLRTNTSTVSQNVWHHYMASFDLSDTSKRHVYIDGVEVSAGLQEHTDEDIPVTDLDELHISPSGSNSIVGSMVDFWLDFGTYIDLSVEENRRKFIDESGSPKYLGLDGGLPTGSTPDIFLSGLSGNSDNWHTNKGSGGGFAEIGTLTTSSISAPYSNITATQIVPNGLVGHWRFDEGSGTLAADSSGNGNNGTLGGGGDIPTWESDGVIDGNIRIQGGQSHVLVPEDASISNLSQMTISTWVYGFPTGGGPQLLNKVGDFVIVSDPTDTRRYVELESIWSGDNGYWRSPNGVLQGNKWTHIAITYDETSTSNDAIIYIDGESVSLIRDNNPTGSPSISASDLYIGNRSSFSNRWATPIDDMRIYNRILTPTEISEIYNARDGIRYNENQRTMEYFDGNEYVSMTPEWRAPDPNPQGPGYLPNAVNFDGSTYFEDNDGITLPTTQQVTISYWFKRNNPSGNQWIFDGASDGDRRMGSYLTTAGTIFTTFEDSIGSTVLGDAASYTPTTGTWNHYILSFDSATGDAELYINDVDASCCNNFPGGGIPDTTINDRFSVGGDATGGSGGGQLSADITDLWIDYGTYIDLNVAANRRKFIDASGNPVDLGSDGSLPTGSQPDLFFKGPPDSFATNRGDNATVNFTQIGTLTDATPPGATSAGLIAHYKLDETSGTTAFDSSGNGNDATMVNLTAEENAVQGTIGGAFTLNGVDEHIEITDTAMLNQIEDEVTIAFWTNNNLHNSGWDFFIHRQEGAGVNDIWSISQAGVFYGASFRTQTDNEIIVSSNNANDDHGQWVHIAASYDGSNVRLYRNGVQIDIAPLTGTFDTTSTNVARIGAASDSGPADDWMHAIMDDVRIYDRALSVAEITQLYQIGTPVGSSTALPQGCPNIGDVCDDGTFYASDSPDGSVEMFISDISYEVDNFAWNDDSGNHTTSSTTSTSDGDGNTLTLVQTDSATTGGFQIHDAAQYCYDLVAHGADDWYLPAEDELIMFDNSGTLIADITGGDFYWSSTESSLTSARARDFDNGFLSSRNKNTNIRVRCVRKGPAPRCANPYGIEGSMVYNTTHDVMQYCDGARWVGIGKYN